MRHSRIIAFLLAAILILSAFSGCTKTDSVPLPDHTVPEGNSSETINRNDDPDYTVKTVDEFIAAIAPGAEIILAPGIFNLSEATTYSKKDTGSEYCYWYDAYDGYELRIRDVDNLTIRGAGKDLTQIQSEPRFGNVLYFENCTNIHVSDFTAGHTAGNTDCIAGVLFFDGCNRTEVFNCGLYGCGSSGVDTNFCNNMTVHDCEIYECTSSAVWFNESINITMENCYIHDLGTKNEYCAITAFGLYRSNNVQIRSCNVQGNMFWYYLSCTESYNVAIEKCGAADNEIRDAAFSLNSSEVTLDDTEITGNIILKWYSDSSDSQLMDSSQRHLTADDLETMYGQLSEEYYTEGVSIKEAYVHTVDEFLAAIAPNTCIYLDAPVFDLTTASDYGGFGGMYYEWRKEFDGPSLWICDVENLTITSPDYNKNNHSISTDPRYADVLAFDNCRDITLSGFTAGHSKEPGFCSGGVLRFENSDEIYISTTNLYGCGILGIQSEHCSGLYVYDTNIYECSYGGVSLSRTSNIIFNNCSYWSLGGPTYNFDGCKDITVDGKTMRNGSFG